MEKTFAFFLTAALFAGFGTLFAESGTETPSRGAAHYRALAKQAETAESARQTKTAAATQTESAAQATKAAEAAKAVEAPVREAVAPAPLCDDTPAFAPMDLAQLQSKSVPMPEFEDDLFKWYRLPDGRVALVYKNLLKDDKGKMVQAPPATVYSLFMQPGRQVIPGHEIMTLTIPGRSKAKVKSMTSLTPLALNPALRPASILNPGTVIGYFSPRMIAHDSVVNGTATQKLGSMKKLFYGLWESTGLCDIIRQTGSHFPSTWSLGLGRVLMIAVGLLLIYLAIAKGFEPLLLLPIGFGATLANIPLAGIAGPDGLLGIIYMAGIGNGMFPLLIFMGVGAMTDFGPLLANPKSALLGAAAQFGIFTALLGALVLAKYGIPFDLKDAASIGIIGGADGPTALFLTNKLSPKLLGAVAVAAYSYMALVPIIQPPIMKLLTTKAERKIKMKQLRPVSKLEKICFPLLITLICAFLLPDAAPLIGMLMFGNLMRECGVVDRLSDTTQNALINIVTIFLGVAVGAKLSADQFLTTQTLGILVLGAIAFSIGTAAGVLFGKLMNKLSRDPINPLIGAAGVSAVPMAARVVNKIGLESDPRNFLLMHAMGPNVAGVIGSAVAAGVLLKALGGL